MSDEWPRCVGVIVEPLMPSRLSPEPAAHRVLGGCRHEHITELFLCDDCITRTYDGSLWCADCWNLNIRSELRIKREDLLR